MTKPNDGGPAFPSEQGRIPEGTWNQTYEPGMSIRDYAIVHFAAAWVIALSRRYADDGYTDIGAAEESMRLAAMQADAMLAKREGEGGGCKARQHEALSQERTAQSPPSSTPMLVPDGSADPDDLMSGFRSLAHPWKIVEAEQPAPVCPTCHMERERPRDHCTDEFHRCKRCGAPDRIPLPTVGDDAVQPQGGQQ